MGFGEQRMDIMDDFGIKRSRSYVSRSGYRMHGGLPRPPGLPNPYAWASLGVVVGAVIAITAYFTLLG